MKQFAIAISYASEDRTLVEAVAVQLAQIFLRDRVFYDMWHPSAIRGRNSLIKLSAIYENKCELIVPFFSEFYKVKFWTNHEWQSIREVMFQRLDDDCVLPVFVSDIEIDGWPKTGLGIKIESKTAEQIAQEIREYYETLSNTNRSKKPSAMGENLKDTESKLEPIAQSELDSTNGFSTPSDSDHNAPRFGSLVAIDLVNSSDLTGQQLREAISGLRAVAYNAMDKAGVKSHVVANYLDGLLIAPGNIAANKVLDLADRCLNEMAHTYKVCVKGAIHRGDYHHVSKPDVIVGKKPYECIFLATLAASNQIVVSEAFVQHWIEDNGTKDLPTLMPPCEGEPWEVEFKQGVTSRFRLVTRSIGHAEVSRSLQEFSLANQALRRSMEGLCYEFDLMIEGKTGVKANALKTRVSLFVPNPERTALVATTHRYLRYAEPNKEKLQKPGVTAYSLHPTRSGLGPLGLAYLTGHPQALNDLPKFSGRGTEYIKMLSHAPWSLDAGLISTMGRKARAFLAIPISLAGTNGESREIGIDSQKSPEITSEGVICLDMKHPLSQLSIDDLKEMGEVLAFSFGTEVASLWRLRK